MSKRKNQTSFQKKIVLFQEKGVLQTKIQTTFKKGKKQAISLLNDRNNSPWQAKMSLVAG